MFRKKRQTAPPIEARDDLIARLLRDGFLEQELRLSQKSERLLAANPGTMDSYTYWCVAIHAREAGAVVAGTSVEMAAIGGPFMVEGDATEVALALSALVSQPTMPDGSPWESEVAAMREP